MMQKSHQLGASSGGDSPGSPCLRQLARVAVMVLWTGTATAWTAPSAALPRPSQSSFLANAGSTAGTLLPPLALASPRVGHTSGGAAARVTTSSCMSVGASGAGIGAGAGGDGGNAGGALRRRGSPSPLRLRAEFGSLLLAPSGGTRGSGSGARGGAVAAGGGSSAFNGEGREEAGARGRRGRGGGGGGGPARGETRASIRSAAAPATGTAQAAVNGRAGREGRARFSWRRRGAARGDQASGAPRGRGRRDRVEASSAFASEAAAAAAAAAAGGAGAGAAAAAAAGKEVCAAGGERGAGAAKEGTSEGAERTASFRVGPDLMADVKRRAKVYKSDWTDGFNRKSLPAILFLYFACLLPAVAFGGIAFQVTQGTLGVIEYVVSCGLGGIAYSTFSGQPMTFIGPTGLTLAFMTSLYSFTSVAGLPFLPVYAWVGLWTSLFLVTLSLIGASNLIEFATQFTDDVFNALLSVNFIYEAGRSLMRNFNPAVAGFSQAGALMSMNVAIATYVGCRKTSGALNSMVFNTAFREFISDFGPLLVILGMSLFCGLPFCTGLLSFLEVPSSFMLCNGRSWLVPLFSVSPTVRIASALPAMLLTSLFFLDQNISSRVVNSPRHKMAKGAAYHQDMLVLGTVTGLLSLVGLPWQCAATVQSLSHVRQMATFETAGDGSAGAAVGTRSEIIESVRETRLTGFCVHALVLGSLALLPQLAKIPMAVVSGIFLYLGRKVMSGNAFLIRCKELIVDRKLLRGESDFRKVGFGTAAKYTAVQAAMLTLLWTLKSFKRTALFFPSVIGLLVIVRLFALPKMFSSKDLSALDAAVG